MFADFEISMQKSLCLVAEASESAASVLISGVESVMLSEHTADMYNVSRLIKAIPEFKNASIFQNLENLIQTANLDSRYDYNEQNFFAKIQTRHLIHSSLTPDKKHNMTKELELVNQFLKSKINRY